MNIRTASRFFVNRLNRQMKRYCIFDSEQIKAFGYLTAWALLTQYSHLLGKDISQKDTYFFNKKINVLMRSVYYQTFSFLLEHPNDINLDWIPQITNIDKKEFIATQENSPLNLSMLIFISYCYNPKLLMCYKKDSSPTKSSLPAFEYDSICFLNSSFMKVLDIFDLFNDALLKEFKLFKIPR